MEIRELEDKIIELTNRVEKLEKEKAQKHEFKVGDRVQFKSWEEMEREFGADDYGIFTSISFIPKMEFLCGSYATIKSIDNYFGRVELTNFSIPDVDGNKWIFSLDMLKSAVNEPKQWKFTEDEKVILRNLPKEYNWIARDSNKDLYIYITKPCKIEDIWDYDESPHELDSFEHLFQTIQWDDAEPCEFRKFI